MQGVLLIKFVTYFIEILAAFNDNEFMNVKG